MTLFLSSDTGILALGHFVWTVLSLLLVFSLLGAAHTAGRGVNLDNLRDPAGAELFVRIAGDGVWLVGVTLVDSALASLGHSWLWVGLLFCLVVLAALATLMAVFEVRH